jgi:hypothetical protein
MLWWELKNIFSWLNHFQRYVFMYPGIAACLSCLGLFLFLFGQLPKNQPLCTMVMQNLQLHLYGAHSLPGFLSFSSDKISQGHLASSPEQSSYGAAQAWIMGLETSK